MLENVIWFTFEKNPNYNFLHFLPRRNSLDFVLYISGLPIHGTWQIKKKTWKKNMFFEVLGKLSFIYHTWYNNWLVEHSFFIIFQNKRCQRTRTSVKTRINMSMYSFNHTLQAIYTFLIFVTLLFHTEGCAIGNGLKVRNKSYL